MLLRRHTGPIITDEESNIKHAFNSETRSTKEILGSQNKGALIMEARDDWFLYKHWQKIDITGAD